MNREELRDELHRAEREVYEMRQSLIRKTLMHPGDAGDELNYPVHIRSLRRAVDHLAKALQRRARARDYAENSPAGKALGCTQRQK